VDLEHGVTALSPLQLGRVTDVPACEGRAVPANAILLRVDDRHAQAHLNRAEAALTAAQANLAKAARGPQQHLAKLAQQQAALVAVRCRLSAARQVLARKQELLQGKQINEREVAVANEQVKEMEALEESELARKRELDLHDPALEVQLAEAEANARAADRDDARHSVQDCELKAPTAGTVVRVQTSPGELIGGPGGQPAILFGAEGPRLIRAEIQQEFAAGVKAGQRAHVQEENRTDPIWHGRVRRVSGWYTRRRSVLLEPLQLNDLRTLECLITLDPDQPPLRIGQRVRVTIEQAPLGQ